MITEGLLLRKSSSPMLYIVSHVGESHIRLIPISEYNLDALKYHNDPSVVEHFSPRKWVEMNFERLDGGVWTPLSEDNCHE